MKMKKNILAAGALAGVVIVGILYLYSVFFMTDQNIAETVSLESKTAAVPDKLILVSYQQEGKHVLSEREISAETDQFSIKFSTRGAAITSLILKNHPDVNGDAFEMVFPNSLNIYPGVLYFNSTDPESGIYSFNKIDNNSYVFTIVYQTDGGDQFQVTKKWIFDPADYLFSLEVDLKVLEGEIPQINESGGLYSLATGFELGPVYETLDNRYDYRKFTIYADQGKGYPKISSSKYLRNDEPILWAAVESRYFAEICIPPSSIIGTEYDRRKIAGNSGHHEIRFIRQAADLSVNSISDSYFFYMGPKRKGDLIAYNSSDNNSFGISEMGFESLIDPGKLLRPLVNLFGALLRQFYFRLIPNYGVAIIFLAVIIKLLIYPLSKKSIWTNLKIRTLQPELMRFRKEAAGDRGIFKQKQSELYMKEGIKPIMSVLPLILQLVVFVALYRLLGTDFDMMGAVFIPGIIPDLSLPDTLVAFNNYALPVLGWKAVRLLPILMLAVTFVQTRFTQPPDSADKNLNRASYLVPVLIFVVLYKLPSGVVLYWISQTTVSIIEHFIVSRNLAT